MAKVKKTAAVTGVRNVKASKKLVSKKAASKSAGKRRVKSKVERARKATSRNTKTRPVSNVKSIAKARANDGRGRSQAPAPVVRFAVKPLEPQAKCGAGTSVQYLFKVDQTVDGKSTSHLVFFDRHGWYCEHGRNCPAVGHAKKYQGHMARAS